MYKVIKPFADLQDHYHRYTVGDIFPRKGLKVTKARLSELSGAKNRMGEPLIVEEAEADADADA